MPSLAPRHAWGGFAPRYDWSAAARWYQANVSMREISRRLGCTYRAVTLARRRLQWSRPAGGRAHA